MNEILFYVVAALAVVLSPFLFMPIGPFRFIISFVALTVSYFTNHLDGSPELSPMVFWILFALLFPSLLLPFCAANLLLYSLILTNLHQFQQFPWAASFWLIIFVIPIALACIGMLHRKFLIAWIPISVIFLKEIQLRWDIIYGLTWYNILFTLNILLRDDLPLMWSIICALMAISLEILIHPGESYIRYLLFSVAIFLLIFAQAMFPWFYIYPETYLFPFNLIGDRFKLTLTKWYPASQRLDVAEVLCPQCQQLTANSKLLMGSWFPLVKLTAWHTISLDRVQLASSPPCHLCHLLWHSVDITKDSPTSEIPWRVKIWEERPLSRFKFMKLFYGQNPVGPRLIVYAGDLFPPQSQSLGFHDTGSHGSIAQAKSWLESCQSNHKRCDGPGCSPRKLPARVVQVLSPADDTAGGLVAKLMEVDPSDHTIQYLALSHRWGNTPSFQLKQANYETCLERFDLDAMSKNVRHALQVTRDLGYSYVWIDSLCIKQDSIEDWTEEAAKMGDVYAGAICTLASTSSESDEGGFFHKRNPLGFRPCKIGVSSLDALDPEPLYIRLDDLANFRQCVDASPLNKRGWVTQERLLSRRILHFGSELLYWECCQRAASEMNPTGFIYKEYPTEFYGNFIPPPAQVDPVEPEDVPPWSRTELIRRRIPAPDLLTDTDQPSRAHVVWQGNRGFWKENRRHSHLSWSSDSYYSRFRTPLDRLENIGSSDDLDAGMLSISHLWYEIVEGYTRTSLTFASDRLVAISGIMQRVERASRTPFAFGLLTGEHLVVNLLWFVSQGPGERLCIPQAGRSKAPIATDSENDDINNSESECAPRLPTWSWASVDAPVTLDLLPDNSNRQATIIKLASAVVLRSQPIEGASSPELTLELQGPFSKVRKVQRVGDELFITTDRLFGGSARFRPDLASFEKHLADGVSDLFCMSCVVLKRENERILKIWRTEVQGLVLRRVITGENDRPDIFERVGFFTTNQLGLAHHKSFKDMNTEVIHLR